jgi:hypothetical protein
VVIDTGPKNTTNEDAFQSERRSALKKQLTEPTLLEMSGYPTNQELALVLIFSSADPVDLERTDVVDEFVRVALAQIEMMHSARHGSITPRGAICGDECARAGRQRAARSVPDSL